MACVRHSNGRACVEPRAVRGRRLSVFIGVLRDRLGDKEDRFFASVFFGSGLLFLAMLFAAAALVGAVNLTASSAGPNELINSATFRFARTSTYIILNVYAVKMAAVFIISTSTVIIYTGIVPRWMAYVGFLLALVVLVGSYYITWRLRHSACLGLSDQHPRAAGQPAAVARIAQNPNRAKGECARSGLPDCSAPPALAAILNQSRNDYRHIKAAPRRSVGSAGAGWNSNPMQHVEFVVIKRRYRRSDRGAQCLMFY